MKKLKYILIFCFAPLGLLSQDKVTLNYIEQYKNIAIQEMKRTGIPASITLAQAIVESASGESELAKKSNNHFGIKCKLDWKGETTTHDDDTKKECFRVYPNVNSSFKDHSDFLKNRPNYAPLFQLDPVDDSAWAYGLKKAGYATAADYPKKLLKVIDDYELSQYNFPELLEEVEAFSTEDSFEVITTPTKGSITFTPDTLVTAKDTTKPIVFTFKNKEDTTVKLGTVKVITQTSTPILTDSIPAKKDTINSPNTVESVTVSVNNIKGIATSDTLSISTPNKINSIGVIKETEPPVSAKEDNVMTDSSIITIKKPIYNYPTERFRVNQVPAIWAKRGTSMLSIASTHNVSLFKLFEYNHLKETDLLENDQLIFLAPKKKEGNKSIHIVKEGESLYTISQTEGIQLQALLTYNNIKTDTSVEIGRSLLLVKPKEQKNTIQNLTESNKQEPTIKKEDWNFFKKKKNK